MEAGIYRTRFGHLCSLVSWQLEEKGKRKRRRRKKLGLEEEEEEEEEEKEKLET